MKSRRPRGTLVVMLVFLLVVILAITTISCSPTRSTAGLPADGGSFSSGTLSIGSENSSTNVEPIPTLEDLTLTGEAPDIADIPAYGTIEPSGCGHHKGRVKIRFDMFMTSDAPYYDEHHVGVVDETSPEYLAGYPGKVDDEGNPLDPEAYQEWFDSLPHIWQDNPFHSHMVYFDTEVTDDEILAKLVEVTEYFYAFHLYCWENSKEFTVEWQKVSTEAGTVRDVFVPGSESEVDCNAKADDIEAYYSAFDTRQLEKVDKPPVDLNIGEEVTGQ